MPRKPDRRPKAADRKKRAARVLAGLPEMNTPEERRAQFAAIQPLGTPASALAPHEHRDLFPRALMPALKSMKFRVKPEYRDDPLLCDLAGAGLEGIIKVLNGRVHSKRAPSVLKAAFGIRAEVCEPVVTESKVTGTISLAAAVAEANTKLLGGPSPVATPASAQTIDVTTPASQEEVA